MKTEIEVPEGMVVDEVTFKPKPIKWPKARDACRLPIGTNEVVIAKRQHYVALQALAQLLALRDIVNDGWEPDWDSYSNKYCLNRLNIADGIVIWKFKSTIRSFAFKDQHTAEEFLARYADLIEQAQDVL